MSAFTITSPRGIAAFVTGLGAVLMGAGLIAAAPPASAGCVYPGWGVISKCDGPIQPDGTWERCVAVQTWVPHGASSYQVPVKHCDSMGADQRPADPAIADPPVHIDD
ncbi:hypothetical protein A9X01_28450 [Mycobacterium asiaticum]|uniref:CDGP domain-containing protein n=2 Tax=Mycobacterium asiaticum TaxID=1790 RepID=A0A1A3BU15_MYCAS|nr:hypothetical protein [Mycobacterium asiaticum]OBI77522.1 hypothetical protein A9X01_28450 [Mycobacterium asiaticum]